MDKNRVEECIENNRVEECIENIKFDKEHAQIIFSGITIALKTAYDFLSVKLEAYVGQEADADTVENMSNIKAMQMFVNKVSDDVLRLRTQYTEKIMDSLLKIIACTNLKEEYVGKLEEIL